MASAVAFCAVPSSHLPTTSTTSHFLPDASSTSWMPLWRSVSTEVPATPRTSRILPPFGHVLDQPVAPEHAEALLVDVDVDRVLGVEDVVEGDEDDAGFLGALDHRARRPSGSAR